MPGRETSTTIKLRWRDMDMLGHLNQAVYHELLEDARGALLQGLAADAGFNSPQNTYVLARVELDYRSEVRKDHGEVTVVCRVQSVGTSSMVLENDVVLPDGTVAATGISVLVGWDAQARTKRALSAAERAALIA